MGAGVVAMGGWHRERLDGRREGRGDLGTGWGGCLGVGWGSEGEGRHAER